MIDKQSSQQSQQNNATSKISSVNSSQQLQLNPKQQSSSERQVLLSKNNLPAASNGVNASNNRIPLPQAPNATSSARLIPSAENNIGGSQDSQSLPSNNSVNLPLLSNAARQQKQNFGGSGQLGASKASSGGHVQLPVMQSSAPSAGGINNIPPASGPNEENKTDFAQQNQISQSPMRAKTGDQSVLASPSFAATGNINSLVLHQEQAIHNMKEEQRTTIQSRGAIAAVLDEESAINHDQGLSRTRNTIGAEETVAGLQMQHAQSEGRRTEPLTPSKRKDISVMMKRSLPERSDDQQPSAADVSNGEKIQHAAIKHQNSQIQSATQNAKSRSGFFSCFSCCSSKSNSSQQSNRRKAGPLQPERVKRPNPSSQPHNDNLQKENSGGIIGSDLLNTAQQSKNGAMESKSQPSQILDQQPLSEGNPPLSINNSLSKSPLKIIEPSKSADQSRAQIDNRNSFDGLPGGQQVFQNNASEQQTSNPGGVNYNGIDAIDHNEIKVNLPINPENDTSMPVAARQKMMAAAGSTNTANNNNNHTATLKNGSAGNGSNMDSCTDDDEIEDENRNSAAMQINHSNCVTRAGAQRNAFGPGQRQISPSKPKPNWGAYGTTSLPLIPEFGTEETVIRTNHNMDHNQALKLSQSPSIRDIQRENSGVTMAVNALEKSENGTDGAYSSQRPIQPEISNQVTPRSGSQEESQQSNGKISGINLGSSMHYQSAKIINQATASPIQDANGTPSQQNSVQQQQLIQRNGSNGHFDHQQELKDLHAVRGGEDHTFGNQNSKRSIMEHEDPFKVTEAGNGNAIGQENAIIRPSGSKVALQQSNQKQSEDVAPSTSNNGEDMTNQMPNSSTAIASSFTGGGPNKQDSTSQQQRQHSSNLDVSLGVSQMSQPERKVNAVNASKIQPVSTKSRPTPHMATVTELNNTGVKMRSSEAGAFNHRGMVGASTQAAHLAGKSPNQILGQRQESNNQRWVELDRMHVTLKRQYRDSRQRTQYAVRRLHKIQKDLKNAEQDNQELTLMLNTLLQRKLLQQQCGQQDEQRSSSTAQF